MKKIIDIADFAPEQMPKLLDVTEWSIDQYFMPALRTRLQLEEQTMGEIYLDFSNFENVNHLHEEIMKRIILLLQELNILQRITFINLPYAFYDYLRRICTANAVLAMRFENI